MESKIFTFNASSFFLDASVESYLRAQGAVSIDFGAAAYINSELMPEILSELIGKSDAEISSNTSYLEKLKGELASLRGERDDAMAQNANVSLRIGSLSSEIVALKEQNSSALKSLENLQAENTCLQLKIKSASGMGPSPPDFSDETMKQSNEKLRRELQQIRSESVEAITSLKVLEDENEELRRELEQLKDQTKPVAAQKAV